MAGTALVAVCLAELEQVVHEFPLAFLQLPEGGARLVAILGTPQRNLFVAEDGRWLGSYVPALIRALPFGWQCHPSGKLILCLDEASPLFSTETGLPIFAEDGTLSDIAARKAHLARHLTQQLETTETASLALWENGLLEPWRPPLPGQAAPAPGLLRISQSRLPNLEGTTLSTLCKTGALALAYAQILSTTLLERLGTLAAQTPLFPSTDSPEGLKDLEFEF